MVIQARGLGKKYSIGGRKESYDTLRDAIVNAARNGFGRVRRIGRTNAQDDNIVWALRDVSFEVNYGEVLGIIGANGAGKTTLLRILSRITRPSTGSAVIHGRVGSLLEVGTGFHPELTGRENIYLSGAVLGMRKSEIRTKFDEIVAFSGLEKFLDTPVKRYSSGMSVRLGFAVAAHLEPEILLVDEVLAVGDAEFQKKCVGKLENVATRGRTVLFVSHNLGVVEHLCSRVLLIEKGHLVKDGNPQEVIDAYLSSNESFATSVDLLSHPSRDPTAIPVFQHLEIENATAPGKALRMGDGLRVRFGYRMPPDVDGLRVGITIDDLLGQRLVNFSPSHQCPDLLDNAPLAGTIECVIPHLNLMAGNYFITLICSHRGGPLDKVGRAVPLAIGESNVFNTGQIPDRTHGYLFLPSEWAIERSEETHN